MEGSLDTGYVDVEWLKVSKHPVIAPDTSIPPVPPSLPKLPIKKELFFSCDFQEYKTAIYFFLRLWNSKQLLHQLRSGNILLVQHKELFYYYYSGILQITCMCVGNFLGLEKDMFEWSTTVFQISVLMMYWSHLLSWF